eukprot:RCo015917
MEFRLARAWSSTTNLVSHPPASSANLEKYGLSFRELSSAWLSLTEVIRSFHSVMRETVRLPSVRWMSLNSVSAAQVRSSWRASRIWISPWARVCRAFRSEALSSSTWYFSSTCPKVRASGVILESISARRKSCSQWSRVNPSPRISRSRGTRSTHLSRRSRMYSTTGLDLCSRSFSPHCFRKSSKWKVCWRNAIHSSLHSACSSVSKVSYRAHISCIAVRSMSRSSTALKAGSGMSKYFVCCTRVAARSFSSANSFAFSATNRTPLARQSSRVFIWEMSFGLSSSHFALNDWNTFKKSSIAALTLSFICCCKPSMTFSTLSSFTWNSSQRSLVWRMSGVDPATFFSSFALASNFANSACIAGFFSRISV